MRRKRSVIGAFLTLAVTLAALSGGTDIIKEGSAVSASVAARDVQVSSRLWELLFGGDGASDATAVEHSELMLIPGGGVFGARVQRAHPSVDDPGALGELASGDVIISANKKEIHAGMELSEVVRSSGGAPILLHIERGGRALDLSVTPKECDGVYSLGVTLRDTAAGIGTITYIDPSDGSFGGLGHGICDSETRKPTAITGGRVTGALLGGIQKGEAGKPGELSGILTDRTLGEVYLNTSSGVFGKLEDYKTTAEALPVGKSSDVHAGEATIISTVKNGKTMEYSVKIFDIDRGGDGTKCFKVKVTDPTLIALTGGIVKGMSGSPIIQDGKLVGAVTHVMVADPTEGYGIFIENMLSASRAEVQPKAA